MDYPTVSSDKTHHVFNGSAIYEKRFIKVRPFCFPGLAAVKDESGWYHIDFFGNPVYSQRYSYAGDFIDSTARVQTSDGMWHYITEVGSRIDPMNFIWGSDFQERVACVYHEKYGAAHITTSGELLYSDWYLDVRPFENEKAKVRDASGWHFINKQGEILGDAIEPDDTFPRGSVCQLHRPNKIAEFVHSSSFDACVILIRHAEREPFWRGEGGFHKRITDRGRLAAQKLGEELPPLAQTYSSPISRCMESAELISGSKPIADSALGNPSAYIFDNSLSHEFYVANDTIMVIRSYIKGTVLPGHYPIQEGSARFLSHLKSVAESEKCVLCVTHDAFIVSFIANYTGYDFADDWVDFLDGCVLLRNGDSWKLVWREGEYAL